MFHRHKLHLNHTADMNVDMADSPAEEQDKVRYDCRKVSVSCLKLKALKVLRIISKYFKSSKS